MKTSQHATVSAVGVLTIQATSMTENGHREHYDEVDAVSLVSCPTPNKYIINAP